jgi:hypothetical protein
MDFAQELPSECDEYSRRYSALGALATARAAGSSF